MVRARPLPEQLKFNGRPYWEHHGGGAVTLVGWGLHSMFPEKMTEAGHTITRAVDTTHLLRYALRGAYPGELGVVVVYGTVHDQQFSYKDMTLEVPKIVREEAGQYAPLLYVAMGACAYSLSQLSRAGYDGIVPYCEPRSRVIDMAVLGVSALMGQVPAHEQALAALQRQDAAV